MIPLYDRRQCNLRRTVFHQRTSTDRNVKPVMQLLISSQLTINNNIFPLKMTKFILNLVGCKHFNPQSLKYAS
ncbi:hypothetical protein NC652_006431 [Populus alba x Populus x berolinensis]|nr:hypothetical protein NC652_006431 [Populus alba x Populus x berolinensis]